MAGEKRPDPMENRSYARHFLIASIVVMVSSALTFWDEGWGRRPWKMYQAEFERKAGETLAQKIKEAKKSLESEDYRKASADLKAIEEKIRKDPERKRLLNELSDIDSRISEARHGFLMDRGDLQEMTYKMEKAHEDGKRAQLLDGIQKIEARLAKSEEDIGNLEKTKKVIRGHLKELLKDKEEAERRLSSLEASLKELEERLTSIKKEKRQIYQQFNPELNMVDRCQSCHRGIERPGFEELSRPHATHPAVFPDAPFEFGAPREPPHILSVHPVEKFGCTVCHRGQGYATSSPEKAHGDVEFWLAPMLRGKMVQASCLRCHEDEPYLFGAEVLNRGRRLFLDLGCIKCHTVRGFESEERAREIGPDLRRIREKVTPGWLVRWIEDPKSFRPMTKMPMFFLDRDQAVSIASYLWQAPLAAKPVQRDSRAHPDGSPPVKMLGGPPEAGKKLFENIGCLGCHRIGDIGGNFAPDLSRVGEKIRPAYLVAWLRDPGAHHPQGRMPGLRLSRDEARHLAAYLKEKDRTYPVISLGGSVETGKGLFESFKCRDCHRMGEEGGNIGPDLTRVGERRSVSHIVSWLLDPGLHQPRGRMPSLRLTEDEAKNIATYLLTLKEQDHDDEGVTLVPLDDPKKAEEGKELISLYGCFGCHIIPGMEKKGKVGADLSEEGSKPIEQFDFGLLEKEILSAEGLHTPRDNVHTARVAWLRKKLSSPKAFDAGKYKKSREKLRMPDFSLSQEDADALGIFLVGLTSWKAPNGYRVVPGKNQAAIIEGRRAMERVNCQGCHQLAPERILLKNGQELIGSTRIEEEGTLFFQLWRDVPQPGQPGQPGQNGQNEKKAGDTIPISSEDIRKRGASYGGDIIPIIVDTQVKEKGMVPDEARVFAPPVLFGEGRKVQADWLFRFIKKPVQLRPWLTVRMPSFYLTDEEVTAIVRMFMALEEEVYPFVHFAEKGRDYIQEKLSTDPGYFARVKRLMDSSKVNCGSCHIRGRLRPTGDPSGWAPDMTLSRERLNPSWVRAWLRDPQQIQPGTKMPKFPWGGFQELLPGDAEKQVLAIVDYLMSEELIKLNGHMTMK